MKKKLLFMLFFCPFVRSMQQDRNPEIALPSFARFNPDNSFKLPYDKENDYKFLTFDTADDDFYSALSDPSPDIIGLTLHTNPPAEAVAFGAARASGKFEFFSDCDRAITGFDMTFNPENPKEKVFVVCRQEGWCTLFDLEDSAFVNKWITNEDLIACYFESSKTVICVSATQIYRWNFTTLDHAVTRLGAPPIIPRSKKDCITIRKSLLPEELQESSDDESFHTCSSGDDDQYAEQAPRKGFWGRLRWLAFGRKPFRR